MLQLHHRDSRPLHEQVREGMRELIVSGALQAHEKLPAVRELATRLTINPNTIARAYRDLEAEGYAYSVAGKGTFVSPRDDVDERRRGELWAAWESAARELLFLGVGADALRKQLDAIAKNTEVKPNDHREKSQKEL